MRTTIRDARLVVCVSLVVFAGQAVWCGAVFAATPVQSVHGRYCAAAAPRGWSVVAENPAGSAFGADLARADGAALASYMVFGVAPEMRMSPYYQQWYGSPDQAVLAQVTQFGTRPMNCNRPQELLPGSGYFGFDCQSPSLYGTVAFKVFDMGNGGYVVVMRTAGAPPANWNGVRREATAVARSVECQIPLVPSRSGPDMPSSGGKPRPKDDDDGDSGYSPWLGMENYHDSTTGQNYWVSPSTDWHETGSQGPGYYVTIGNDVRKLESGLSQ
jgi:hypothetical protein